GHDGNQVWLGTDGGVFRSLMRGQRESFVARNQSLAITQLNYLAQRPDTAAVVFAGSQDNGTLRRTGGPVWYESPMGDGGGVAVDPADPYRVLCQYTKTSLSRATDGGLGADSWRQVVFPPV